MKNLKCLLLFSCLSLFFFASCSDESSIKDNSDDSTNKLNASELKNAISAFEAISKSADYVRFREASKLFAANLNGAQNVPNSDRAEFVKWISGNLAQTKFPTTSDAISEYDEMHSLGEVFLRVNNAFWQSLRAVDEDDIGQIFAPIVEPIHNTINGVCQEACMDAADSHIQIIYHNFVMATQEAAYSGNYGAFIGIQNNYDNAFAEIAVGFSVCMGSCPSI